MFFLIGCAKIGYVKTRKQVLGKIRTIVANKCGKDPDEVHVTMGWWTSFCKRHPQLIL